MVVGDLPLGLERRDHRRVDPFGQRDHLFTVKAGAMADDDDRPLGRPEQVDGLLDAQRPVG